MSVINIKASKQDDIRPNHPDNMGDHPVRPKRERHPCFPTKSSCSVSTKSQPIPHQSNEEQVGIRRPAFERQNGGCEKHKGVGPQIAFSPTEMASWAFWHAESNDADDYTSQSRKNMNDKRADERERTFKDGDSC